MLMRHVCRLGLALCLLPLLMGASVYRWVDENGVVNYTQLKPEGVDAELVSSDTGQRIETPAKAPQPVADTQPTASGEQPLNESQQKMLDDLKATEAARQAELAKIRDANCKQARETLQRLTSRGRIRVVGDDGNERVMPEEERRRRIEEQQRAVAVNCSETASR